VAMPLLTELGGWWGRVGAINMALLWS